MLPLIAKSHSARTTTADHYMRSEASYCKNMKSFQPSGADLRFVSPQPDTSLHCPTTDVGLVHRAVCLFMPPAFTGTHCAYPWRDGQAELTCKHFI